MLEFEDIRLADKEMFDKLLSMSDLRGTEYCFSSNFIWAPSYGLKAAVYKDILVFRSEAGENVSYSFSLGRKRPEEIAEMIDLVFQDRGRKPIHLTGLLDEHIALLAPLYGERMHSEEVRDSFDYLYETEKLISLSGKKLQPKRNLISRFQREYPDWRYEEVTSENLEECKEMARRWCENYGCGQDESLNSESLANRRAMENLPALKLDGGLLRVGGKVIAYTLGERLNSDTYIVHIEKAFPEYTGAYQMIHREFAARHAVGTTYINREDDAGDEGLRKAKLSYQPVELLKKYIATIE